MTCVGKVGCLAWQGTRKDKVDNKAQRVLWVQISESLEIYAKEYRLGHRWCEATGVFPAGERYEQICLSGR